jgi:peptide/nickel transport system ATP-binding protein
VTGIQVRGLAVSYRSGATSRALTHGVDLDVQPGQNVALVGESGSGKSLTARAIAGLLPRGLQAAGDVLLDGRDLMALDPRARRRVNGREVGMVLQDPFSMLTPTMTVKGHITECLPSAASTDDEVRRRLLEVGIRSPDVMDCYPHELSGGMRQRVAIAAALAQDPRLLLCDEITTALDVTNQAEVLDLVRSIQETRRMELIFITHDLRLAFSLCSTVYVMYAGRVVESGSSSELGKSPKHPYTRGLLDSEPPLHATMRPLPYIPRAEDDVPRTGCSFAPRCRHRDVVCLEEPPPLVVISPGRAVACLRSVDLTLVPPTTPAAPAPTLPTGSPAVLVEKVNKTFTAPRSGTLPARQVLTDVDLVVGSGESHGIVGESGSGKTTLARIVAGLESRDSGTVVIGGESLSPVKHRSHAEAMRARSLVQMVFQDPASSLNPALSIGRTLTESLAPNADPRVEVPRLLALVGMPRETASLRPRSLSGGQRQRIAIARALAPAPAVLICDEAVSALDVSVQAHILNLLNDVRERTGVAVLFISHDLAVVRQVTDWTHVMFQGQLVESGPTADVLDNPRHEYTRHLIASIPHGIETSA